MPAGPVLDHLREPVDPTERAVIERYVAAFEAADVPGLGRLLADDVALEMPPVALWLHGREHYEEFMSRVFGMRGTGWRLVPVEVNGGAGLAAYAPDPASGAGVVRAHSVQALEVRDGLVRRSVAFVDPSLFRLFALPAERTA